MHIGLVFPQSTFLIDPMVYPPLGLWYLAAQLEALGHTTDFRDLSVDKFPEDGDYDQVWISATSPQMHDVRRLSDIIRDWTKSRVVFGGAGPWARPESAEELGFDLVVAGESDSPSTVRQILDFDSVGLLSPKITPGPLGWVLPPVRRWGERYHSYLEDHNGQQHRTATVFTSRGCPMACAFCESGRNGIIWDKFVRYEPVEIVDHQLREITDLGHTGVMFYDDILPLNKPRTLEIMKVLKQYGLIWRCFLRTDVISHQGGFEYLKQLADAGLIEVLAGVESADNRIKNAIHKGTTIEQDTQALAWCKTLGIKFKASFILGLPGEDMASMEATREWILTNKPDRVDVNTLIPFPGTPLTRKSDYQGSEYDLKFEEIWPEETFYKGPRDSAQVLVSTSHLTSLQIKEFRDNLIKEIELAGIPY